MCAVHSVAQSVMPDQPTSENKNSYRSILKGTSIFGGVQVFQILINLVRGKFVAMFLGPEGMGIASMFNSSANTLIRFSSLGLNLAFVKEVAANKERPDSFATVMAVADVLIKFTALLGAVVCILLAPVLSRVSFGSPDYAWQYVLLSAAVFLTVGGNGRLALLQGLHQVKLLSLTSLAGALTGLVAGVPLYYFFGNRGIVPAIVILSLTTYLFYTIGLRRLVPARPVRFSFKAHRPIVRRMLALGVILLASSLINTACAYLINIFIRTYGDLADVGLFNSANSITAQYAGVVFTAMALDYFPRLTGAVDRPAEMRRIVNRQMEIVALIATPLSILLVATAPIVIRLLLTSQFLGVTGLMRWLGLSILLKAIAYPLGYITFAKNNRRLFFWLEAVVCNVLYIGCSLVFYHYYGLPGLGYGAVVEQACCVVLYLAVNYKVYGYRPDRKAWTETLCGLLFAACGFGITLLFAGTTAVWLLASVCAVCAWRSFVVLRRRLRMER